jgi:mono/diheme cytochrome c family protein
MGIRVFLSLMALAGVLHAQGKISYDDHVLPIFEQACLNCHNPDKTKGGLDLSEFAGAMKGGSSGKVVEPGDVSSTLISCFKQTAEPNMPPEGEKLSGDQIALLVKWIEGGLLENKSSSARKPFKPKFETALRSNPGAKPEGLPPMPEHLLLEPPAITERPSAVHAIAASPWAPLLAVSAQRQFLLHHTETLELIGILPFPEGDPNSLAFTPDARYLIVGCGVPGKSGIPSPTMSAMARASFLQGGNSTPYSRRTYALLSTSSRPAARQNCSSSGTHKAVC